ncbi:ankyrin repeat and SOCS box protein 18-like isoform X1 [Ptychodera flava]|uniref:ankyrin repeat and SOCS box protein 18-like isoform X1 n=1 Tax=Ptychodera flava TaxID=63121 RepID=UPI00396A8056
MALKLGDSAKHPSTSTMKTVVKACVYDDYEVLDTLLRDGSIHVNVHILFDNVQKLEKYFQYNLGDKLKKVTPIQIAAKLGSPKCMRVLLQHGANLDIAMPYFSPLAIVCRSLPKSPEYMGRFEECIMMLVEAGSDLTHLQSCASPVTGYGSLLHLLVNNKMSVGLMQTVVRHGVDINVTDSRGQTPLHYVMFLSEPIEVFVRALLGLGADPNMQDDVGCSPMLYCASHQDNPQLLQLLYDAGGDPNITDHYGQNALHLACKHLKLESTNFLVERVSDINARTYSFNTAANFLLMKVAENYWSMVDKNMEVALCIQKVLNYGGIITRSVVEDQAVRYLQKYNRNHRESYPLEILGMVVNTHARIGVVHLKEELSMVVRPLPSRLNGFFRQLCATEKIPRRLQHLCRCAIRGFLGSRCHLTFSHTILPRKLQSYLVLEPSTDIT